MFFGVSTVSGVAVVPGVQTRPTCASRSRGAMQRPRAPGTHGCASLSLMSPSSLGLHHLGRPAHLDHEALRRALERLEVIAALLPIVVQHRTHLDRPLTPAYMRQVGIGRAS